MKDLPQRSTRGKRMSELVEEEIEMDELFWGQSMFQETLSDDAYQTESEKEDKFDEDFFRSEGEEHEDAEEPEEAPVPKKTKSERTRGGKRKPAKAPNMGVLSQKDMLEQAAITEMFNAYSLKKLQSLEDTKKRENNTRRAQIQATYRFHDWKQDHKRSITLWTTEEWQVADHTQVNHPVCAVTGKPAKYLDPRTKKYYSSLKAFKTLREQHYKEQEQPHLLRLKELKSKLKRIKC